MRNILVTTVIAFAAITANAGTSYRDRIVPGGVCMVTLNDKVVNAALIQSIDAETFREVVEYKVFGDTKYLDYTAVRVTMVNAHFNEWRLPLDQAIQKRDQFVKIINETCK